jgi:fatty-acyl-CoA synthase
LIAGDLLGERARLTPNALALVTVPEDLRLTYREFDRRVEARAAWLDAQGVGPGDRFGVLAGNQVEFLECFFACGKTGAVIVPIGTRSTTAEIAHVISDSGMKVLLTGGAYALRAADAAQAAGLTSLLSLEGDVPPTGDSALRSHARLGSEDLWALLYTSGTTGKPKGVMIPHRQIVWNAYNTVIGWQLRADDVTAIFTPLYHAGGLAAFLTPIVAIGGTVVLHAEFDPVEVWRTVETEGVTVMLGVPTIYQRLAESPEFARVDLSRVRWLISGGAPLPRYLIDLYQARGVAFKQGYGMTEVGVNCFAMTVEDSIAKAGSIGQPLPFTEARLEPLADGEGRDPDQASGRASVQVDSSDGASVAVDPVGELWLRGPHVCRGYWNRPDATAAALDADGWFHTGDLARRDSDGFYTIAGRAKDMLISGGVNVYPAEIEGELLLHAAVRDAAVVGVADPEWGESGVAFVVAAQAALPTPDELREFLSRSLARHKLPRHFAFVEALPRTASGKVIKGELRERWLAAAGGSGA